MEVQRLVGIEGDSLTKDMASLPLCFGFWPSKCCEDQPGCTLGHLGRLLTHPSEAAILELPE